MYVCDYCSKPTKGSPILCSDPTEHRDVTYTNLDSEGEPKVTVGKEITVEYRKCYTCAGVRAPQVQVEPLHLVALGRGMHEHATRCKKVLSECKMCTANIETFAGFPTHTINRVLTEPKTQNRASFTLGAVAVENLIARTTHKGKRGQADFNAAYPVLKGYEKRGGKV